MSDPQAGECLLRSRWKSWRATLRANRIPGSPNLAPPIPCRMKFWTCARAAPGPAGRPPLPIQQCRLSEIPRHVLRVECIRCLRIVEIQKADAVRFYGPHAVWKDVGQRLLDQTCSNRTGRHEEDGCWPGWLV